MLARPRQRVVMGEEPGARQQHVAGEFRIMQLHRLQGLLQAGSQPRVRTLALDQQIGEEQQETRNNG